MAAKYKLRCSVVGHEKDVRAVIPALYPEGAIITGSRDVTARVWAPNPGDLGFSEAHVMSGHSNFVSSVCIMPPDDKHPQGLIMTGSNDNNILAFTLDKPSPLYKLEGHTNTVCSLAAGKFGTLISGSWDETARVWLSEKCLMTLKGHEAAVWSVAIMPEGGFMLTGSADKSIKMWKAGKCERTFTGHDDCVRSLAVLNTSEFLSCSNDASVRRWLITGQCVQTFYGHTNYVYSLALLGNGQDFVTTGEDRTLRVWQGGECVQTITHPTQSVWCVCVLPNGDIVTGASDGIIRVFSCSSDRQAPQDLQEAFEESVAATNIPTQVGDIPTDQLPGPEALLVPGKREGQSLMVKEDSGIMMYQWDASGSRWTKIGNVVGGSGGSQASSGKQLYKGKEYDYVFDVELTEGQPALKLPYNLSDDAWLAAHNFLADNDLDQMFLDQVAKFIQDQTKGVQLQPRSAPSVSDPFTGGGRYIPSTNGPSSNPQPAQTQPSGVAADPFTGGGSYRPSYMDTATSAPTPEVNVQFTPPQQKYFPQKTFIGFDQANPTAILGKLREFNSQADPSSQLTDPQVAALEGLMTGGTPGEGQLELLAALLRWPAGVLFPALDTLRLAIRTPAVNQHFCSKSDGESFITYLVSCLKPDAPPANQMLALRILTNVFRNQPGLDILVRCREPVVSALMTCKDNSNRNVQIALSSILLNYAVAYVENPEHDAKTQCLSAAVMLAETQVDPEANFRLLVCIGTLIAGDRNFAELATSLGIHLFVNRCKLLENSKTEECAKQLEKLL